MYVASGADNAWVLSVQRKLYTQSWNHPDDVFRKLWGFVTDPRNLRNALARVARNRGRRTSGVDGVTVRSLLANEGADAFLDRLRTELRAGTYRPSPVRRVLLPKRDKPGETRPLGVPTVKDRVVQAALKSILEPIFEAGFYPYSHGFRPATGAHVALEDLRKLLWPKTVREGNEVRVRLPYQWAIEGDIKSCFDTIDHHGLMNRVRRRIGDSKVLRLVRAFLKAGVLAEGQFLRTDVGTPQGGILSPLLANIALSVLEERYVRHAWPRHEMPNEASVAQVKRRAARNRRLDKAAGKPVLVPIRYADDFVILVGVDHKVDASVAETTARKEITALADLLKDQLGLHLSEAKTLVTPVTSPMRFLGHHVRVQRHPKYGWGSKAVIPKDRSRRLRGVLKAQFRLSTGQRSLEDRLQAVNPILRGWGNFYRHAWGAKSVFDYVDHWLWWTIKRWLKKKHGPGRTRWIYRRYGWRKPGGRMIRWRDGGTTPFSLVTLKVERFRHAWLRPPAFAMREGEPGAERKPHAGFGRGGPRNRPA